MDYAKILSAKYPGSEFTLDGEDYSGLTWLSDSPKPTKAKLESYWPEVDYAFQVEQVSELRRAAYVLESDPLNYKWQETQAEEDRQAWLAKKAEIQARYPEPEAPVK